MNDRMVKAEALQPVKSGRWRGFYPIYHKELSYWFGTHRWITQLIIWLSLTAIPAIGMTPNYGNDRGVSYLISFLWLSSVLISTGTIVLAQGTVIEEKLTQTLLWICSKPLSMAGFVLAKFAAYAVFLGTIALGVPAIFIYGAAMIAGLPTSVSLFNYLIALWLIYLLLLFILALTLLLGVVFNRVGTVTAIALFIFFGGASLQTNQQLRRLEPYTLWALPHHATATVVGQFPPVAGFAMGTTIVLTALCLGAAIGWMRRYEM